MLAALCEEGEAHLLEDARALYEHHERDAGDTILMAFKAGNWTKVIFLLRQPPEHLQGFGNIALIVQGGIINLTAVLMGKLCWYHSPADSVPAGSRISSCSIHDYLQYQHMDGACGRHL